MPRRSESYRSVLQRLRTAQKNAAGAPGYSRWVNRRAGRLLAAEAYRLGVTPNQVSALSGILSAGAIVLIALLRPSPALGVVISLLLLLAYALDSADGQVARLTQKSSLAGEWLDHMIDCAKISTMHLAVLIGLWRFARPAHPASLLVPLGFCVVAIVLFFGMILNDQLRRSYSAATGVSVPRPDSSVVRSLALIPTDFGAMCLLFMAWGWHDVFFALYALELVAHVAFLAMASIKWYASMKALDRYSRPSEVL